ncbi:MAG: hypothetical protein WC969_08400 [Elusimicrobiota bacterium]|jgi:hypothetical protein
MKTPAAVLTVAALCAALSGCVPAPRTSESRQALELFLGPAAQVVEFKGTPGFKFAGPKSTGYHCWFQAKIKLAQGETLGALTPEQREELVRRMAVVGQMAAKGSEFRDGAEIAIEGQALFRRKGFFTWSPVAILPNQG